MTNRYGRAHLSLPHCLRKLPENQPRSRQEFMIRRRLIPEDPAMYFDQTGRFLYDTRCVSQELELLKASKRRTFAIIQKQAGYLKSMITAEIERPTADLDSMRRRYLQAQTQAHIRSKSPEGKSEVSNRPKVHETHIRAHLRSKSPDPKIEFPMRPKLHQIRAEVSQTQNCHSVSSRSGSGPSRGE